MGLREFLSINSSTDEEDSEEEEQDQENVKLKKEVEETRTITNRYTSTHSKITYSDGDFENIAYTDADFGDTVSDFYDHGSNDYQIRRTYSYSGPKLYLEIDYEEPDRFVMRHIQNIKTRWENKMIAVVELDVVVEYTRKSGDDEWEKEDIQVNQNTRNLDVTVWELSEWEEQQS